MIHKYTFILSSTIIKHYLLQVNPDEKDFLPVPFLSGQMHMGFVFISCHQNYIIDNYQA